MWGRVHLRLCAGGGDLLVLEEVVCCGTWVLG